MKLRRELKLPTVHDLVREDETARRLPGRARSALRHVLEGDLRAAERALPGEFGNVVAGPWQDRRRRAGRRVWICILALASVLAVLLTVRWVWS